MADRSLLDRVLAAAGGTPAPLVNGVTAERALGAVRAAEAELLRRLGEDPEPAADVEPGEWQPTSWSKARGWIAARSRDLLDGAPSDDEDDGRAEKLATATLLRFLDDRQLGLDDVDLALTTRTFRPWHEARALDTPPTTAQRRRARHLCRVQGPPPTSIIVYAKEDA